MNKEAMRKPLEDCWDDGYGNGMMLGGKARKKAKDTYITSQLSAMEGWKPIATAPKDGSTIKVSDNEDGSEPYLIKWIEQRVCAGDRTYGEGWSQTGIPAGEGLPVDEPLFWLDEESPSDGQDWKADDKELTKMSMELSEKSLAKEWDNVGQDWISDEKLKEMIGRAIDFGYAIYWAGYEPGKERDAHVQSFITSQLESLPKPPSQ